MENGAYELPIGCQKAEVLGTSARKALRIGMLEHLRSGNSKPMKAFDLGISGVPASSWRITQADLWDRDYLDLMEPAHITFEANGHGEFAFGRVNGSLDCEYSRGTIYFNRQGCDEMDEVHGDGSADLEDDGSLEAEIRFHSGDEAVLKAKKW